MSTPKFIWGTNTNSIKTKSWKAETSITMSVILIYLITVRGCVWWLVLDIIAFWESNISTSFSKEKDARTKYKVWKMAH
ncbi:hypothetical protein FOB71_01035 [Vibrio vulnificus]|nr:hypothetical protein [Vibrio vulnificus]QET73618.1 hypothetical protein FOB71_01035 [Vibrio vulnificus]